MFNKINREIILETLSLIQVKIQKINIVKIKATKKKNLMIKIT